MATPDETAPFGSQAEPPETTPAATGVAEELKREVEMLESLVDATKILVDGGKAETLNHIAGLNKMVFESLLFKYCQQLVNMRFARGLTPLSSIETARLTVIQQFARCQMEKYKTVKGSLPVISSPNMNTGSLASFVEDGTAIPAGRRMEKMRIS